jgi:hypothetical protein
MKLRNFQSPGRVGGNGRRRPAFTLLEVIIACAIFFLATFAILQLVSQALSNVRRLERPLVDGTAVLSQLTLTNKLLEGEYSGDLGDLLGKSYAKYSWDEQVTEVQSNHLYQADVVIFNPGTHDPIAHASTLLYRPQSPPGSLDGGNFVK